MRVLRRYIPNIKAKTLKILQNPTNPTNPKNATLEKHPFLIPKFLLSSPINLWMSQFSNPKNPHWRNRVFFGFF